jgi:Ni/Co efflux regulator RcnB
MKLSLVATALLALSTTVAMAQNINQRKDNQQDRIGQGVRSGQLTARETSHLEGREASINREEHAMRRADDGHLTRGDRAALTSRQNRVSRSVYRDKHNAFHRG